MRAPALRREVQQFVASSFEAAKLLDRLGLVGWICFDIRGISGTRVVLSCQRLVPEDAP